jgi:hypothetical protein
VGNDGSREVVSADNGNNGSSNCDSTKALGRHRRSTAATLTEETVRKGLGVGSSCRRRVEGVGGQWPWPPHEAPEQQHHHRGAAQ